MSQSSGCEPSVAPPPVPVSGWRRNSDLIAAAVYLAVSFALDLAAVRRGYDSFHENYFLVSSLRIIEGQRPFVDFFPWYGPLYHYLTALAVRLLGGDLLAVKLYFHLINPLAATIMLVLALRWLGLDWPGRLFAMMANVAWGLDRLMYCGSIRSLLALFLLAAALRGVRSGRARYFRPAVGPAALALFFFSPDAAVNFGAAAVLLAVLDVTAVGPSERRNAVWEYAGGAGASAVIFVVLRLASPLTRNYLDFCSYISSNLAWAYGQPLPGLEVLAGSPSRLLFYAPPLAAAAALGWAGYAVIRHQARWPAWLPVAVMAGVSWQSTILIADPGHLKFALPATTVLLALAFNHWGRAVKIALSALVLLTITLFNPEVFRGKLTDIDTRILGRIFARTPWEHTVPFSGIYLDRDEGEDMEVVRNLIRSRPGRAFMFPLHSFEAYRAGQPFTFPFDELSWNNQPGRREQVMAILERTKPDFLILDLFHVQEGHTHGDSDWLYDYIAENYRLRDSLHSTLIYERSATPINLWSVRELSPNLTLTAQNQYLAALSLPPAPAGGFIDVSATLDYSCSLLRRWSMPIVIVVDPPPATPSSPFIGRNRVSSDPHGGEFRLFVPPNTSRLSFQIFFLGPFNPEAATVAINKIQLRLFTPPMSPTNHPLLLISPDRSH